MYLSGLMWFLLHPCFIIQSITATHGRKRGAKKRRARKRQRLATQEDVGAPYNREIKLSKAQMEALPRKIVLDMRVKDLPIAERCYVGMLYQEGGPARAASHYIDASYEEIEWDGS